MSDNYDPFKPPETILRPRPGGGRRAPSDAALPGPTVRGASVAVADPVAMAASEPSSAGLNPLVQAAVPLLLLAGHLRGMVTAPDLRGLRRHTRQEIERFKERAQAGGATEKVALAAGYVLCAALDEAVLSTPWGSQSEWAQPTLLVELYGEAQGGDKFFQMLERISEDPERHIDVMELQYLCIAFGFEGKYKVLSRGHERLAGVQQELYRRIRSYRGAPQAELSPRWQGVKDRRNRLIRYVPWWVVGTAALAVLAITFAVYHAWLGAAAAPINKALADIGREAFSGPPPAAAAGPSLKQLLADDEARGALSVEEQGGRSTVTLLASNLFGSGSATPNPVYNDMLRRLSIAIDQVPGRVMVVGHTDDQALRSLRYADNFELSRARAASVVRVLQAGSKNPTRFESTGVGPTEPRYRPESDPENRARNRRVEIIHVP